MITADTMVCRVPTEYAVKIEKFYCTVAHPVDSADSQTWATWAGVVVSLIAAVVTLIAVFVAIRQAGDAKIIAENSNSQAVKRELMSRQWDRYEEFARLTVKMVQMVGTEINDYTLLTTDLTHAGNSFTMYLASDSPELGDAVINYSDALQGIGQVINRWNASITEDEDEEENFDTSVSMWIVQNPEYLRHYMRTSAVLVTELRNYYRGKQTADKACSNLREALEMIIVMFKPLLVFYEQETPSFMRKFTN